MRKFRQEDYFQDCFYFWKSFIRGKSQWYAAYFQHISIALDLAHNKNKLHKTLDYWSWVMLNFDFLETVGKCLGIGSQPHVEYDFSRKMFFMLCSINWSIYLPDRLYFFKYCTLCTAIVCFLGCDVINFEFVRIFLIKMFSCMIKKSKEKCRYLDNEKSF